MAAWPGTLPAPLFAGFSISPAPASARTDMETGAARARRRTAARNDSVTAAWRMTDAEIAIFRAWYDADDGAAGGSAWFDVDLALGDGGVSSVEARCVSFRIAQVGPAVWDVSATLEVR